MKSFYQMEQELDQRAGEKPRTNKEIAADIVKKGFRTAGARKLLRESNPLAFKNELQAGLDEGAGVALDGNKVILDLKQKIKQINNGSAACPECGVSGVLIRESSAPQDSTRNPKQSELDNIFESNNAVVEGNVSSFYISLKEADYNADSNEFEVVLIEKGATQKIAEAFTDQKMFLNKPTLSERRQRPEGNLLDWASTIIESWAKGSKVMAKIAVHDAWLKGRLANSISRSGMCIEVEMQKDKPVGIYWLGN